MQKIKLDDFTNYTFISGLEYSPDGKYACFVTHKANMDDNNYDSNLWLYDVAKETYFQLTTFKQERNYLWLADSQHIVFAGARDAKVQEKRTKGEDFTVFYKINIHGGEAKEFFRVPVNVQTIKQVNEEGFLLLVDFDPSRPDISNWTEEAKAMELNKRQEEQDYEVLEEIPYWSNGRGFISGKRNRVYFYNLNDQSLEALTDDKLQVDSVELSPDCSKAVIIGQYYHGKREVYSALYLLDLETKNLTNLNREGNFRYEFATFMDEQNIIYVGKAMEQYGLNENGKFHLVNTATNQHQLLTPDWDQSTWNSVGSDCRYGGSSSMKVEAGFFYFVSTKGGDSHLYRLDQTGDIKLITEKAGSVDAYTVHNDQVLLVRLQAKGLQEVYSLSGNAERQITFFNEWVKQERSIVDLEPLSYQVNEDITIDGWVMKPVGWKEDQKYPAILNIHGGPKTVYGEVFYHEMQYWANQGYFVFFCNPRGSDGKGNEFADIRGKYGTIDYEDLMNFTNLVLEQHPTIDTNRVGVTGGSYGGYMTNWIIGQTDRFKAAASQRSISNWVSMACTTDIGYYFVNDQIGDQPWTNQNRLWDASPLKYADRVTTPTLFIHSEEDYRCWLVEGLQMFTALKHHGVESRLCMFRGENHELSRSGKPQHRIRRLQEITQWFDQYLKN